MDKSNHAVFLFPISGNETQSVEVNIYDCQLCAVSKSMEKAAASCSNIGFIARTYISHSLTFKDTYPGAIPPRRHEDGIIPHYRDHFAGINADCIFNRKAQPFFFIKS